MLAGLTGGLVAALPLALGVEDSAARKNRHGKKHKKHSPHQQPGSPLPSPPPPPPPPVPVIQVAAGCGALPDDEVELFDGDARIAQTFTAGATGLLVNADLQVVKQAGSGGAFILRLSAVDGTGIPTNTVLASASVPNASVGAGPNDLAFAFASPASVVAGTTYALVLTRPGSNSLIWLGHTGDTCAGLTFFSTSQTAAFQPTFSGSASPLRDLRQCLTPAKRGGRRQVTASRSKDRSPVERYRQRRVPW